MSFLAALLLTLIGKSWKTYEPYRFLENASNIFWKFQFSGHEPHRFLGNASNIFSKFEYSGNGLNRFLENQSRALTIYGKAFQKSV